MLKNVSRANTAAPKTAASTSKSVNEKDQWAEAKPDANDKDDEDSQTGQVGGSLLCASDSNCLLA